MESFAELTNTINKYLNFQMNQADKWSINSTIQIFSILASTSIAIYSLYSSNLKSEKNEKINFYKQSLAEFYYPFRLLLKKNEQLYKLFAIEEKNTEFSTLISLLKGYQFSESDKNLLTEILDVNSKLNDLILEKGGLVENNNLQIKLSNLSTHFTVLSLAFNNAITEYNDCYNDIIFPNDIYTSINNEILKIENDINKLSFSWISHIFSFKNNK